MCIAIALPPLNVVEYELPSIDIKRAWCYNSHGAGFSYVSDGEVVIKKGIMKQSELMRKFYKARRDNPESMFLLHLRRQSVGEINKENTHPFFVNDGKLALIHNGTINIKTTGEQSDTQAFADMLGSLPDDFYENEGYERLLGNYVGGSKVAFITDKNKVFILNKEKGLVDGDFWYSNDFYRSDEYDNHLYTEDVDDEFVCDCGNILVFENEIKKGVCFSCQFLDDKEEDAKSSFNDELCAGCGCYLDQSDPMQTNAGMCGECIEFYTNQENEYGNIVDMAGELL